MPAGFSQSRLWRSPLPLVNQPVPSALCPAITCKRDLCGRDGPNGPEGPLRLKPAVRQCGERHRHRSARRFGCPNPLGSRLHGRLPQTTLQYRAPPRPGPPVHDRVYRRSPENPSYSDPARRARPACPVKKKPRITWESLRFHRFELLVITSTYLQDLTSYRFVRSCGPIGPDPWTACVETEPRQLPRLRRM